VSYISSAPIDVADHPLAVRLAGRSEPGILDGVGAFGLIWVASAVVLGVLTGVIGVFQPIIVLLVAAAVAVVLTRPFWQDTKPRVHPADIVVVALIIGWIVFGSLHVAQHVFPGSDPGVYLGTGWWMADHPSPVIDLAPGILDDSDGSFSWSGFYDTGQGSVAPQFPRGLPVVLAIAKTLGGAGGIFLAPVLLGALGLLAVYLFASLFMPRWWGLLVSASLAVNLVFVHFSRDTYSEPLSLLLLCGGTWLAVRSLEIARPRPWLGAGVVLGAALCVRIDALIAISVVPVMALHLAALSREPGERLARIGSIAGVVCVVGLVGLADLTLVEGSYLDAQGGRLSQVLGVVVILSVLAFGAVRFRSSAFVERYRTVVVRAAVGLLAAAFLYAFVIRPLGPHAIGTGEHAFLGEVLGREGQVADPTRSMAEISGRWLWWYLGPLLVAGLAGLLEMIRRTIRRPDVAGTALVGLMAFTAAVYLWRPSVIPLHPWAMRRFLPVVIPCLVILGVWWLATMVSRLPTGWWRTAATVAAVVVALSPVLTLAPVTDTTEQRGAYSFVREVCGQLPANAALFSDASATARQWAPALRIYCDLPVVVSSGARLPELMAGAADDFDVLWFGTGCTLPGVFVVETAAEFPILQFTATHAPDRLDSDFFGIVIVRPTSYDCV
jgi:hypothetical protein